ncbi:undecaprenyldiphospho-muramoylpentapeptide beta-N-acetylglucosaminyltransferase [Bordetella pseudohinzii]|uniref:UDP-N-acetylglucosamine--N-acetylmuramyl-(pentapeptide) pyrophosphoryl-undecaprenol N-acetylglucosamine transferase n=1 Tax=Bordetella pseudohinzii TaxID=1331258 RepID=A0A0J6BWA4_9BORD|nr:undecaprenyldiphospho-muramoylpentapeptide beta-N-acetylglucosaminyltransferase [Bordetella pseudohinzii]ANY15011.1 undecaprenyldiphospho-muramoylpentapeptide beta-N-acetylglucosaminyltransferase [Bordetella pseudohinzii]KMM26044.1 UDP-N-acetylglucosamine--N-acetylmuramyl- (pentapeptide) pyrophosphoryl-UDP N-acetylglucosamine transferase [Bordetella pseudohinzii]KXA79874.1 UDP-N-acetylglucosamine--N-acetylmuramyl-(pentapeptide) pyrophosphoryl-undecaprenol N-acetylglucosamine transferase [Bord
MSAPTILIMAGGTGGHIMPGLAVADILRQRGWQVRWLGNPDKMEGKLVPARGIALAPLRFQGVRGRGAAALFKLPFLLARAVAQAWRHLSAIRPDVVLGMGGYVAFPGGLVAALRRTPMVIHEQNAVAGTANRWLARMASRVLTGFPNVLPGAEDVGNPVRADLCQLDAPAQRYAERQGPLRILVVGGSLGAQALNTVVPQALARIAPSRRPMVTHQAGAQHLQALQDAYAAAGVQAECLAFIDDMAGALARSDLLICRAGAMTVAEVAAAGVAALFVPFPHAIDDHQTANARYLSDVQAAWLQAQSALTPEWLADWLEQRNRIELQAVAERARAQARPDAAEHIADVCMAAARRQS